MAPVAAVVGEEEEEEVAAAEVEVNLNNFL